MTQANFDIVIKRYKNKIPKENVESFKRYVREAPDECMESLIAIRTKNTFVTALFSIFLGCFGVDRFYIGDVVFGLIKLIINIFGICSIGSRQWFTTATVVIVLDILDIYYTHIRAKEVNYDILRLFLSDAIAGNYGPLIYKMHHIERTSIYYKYEKKIDESDRETFVKLLDLAPDEYLNDLKNIKIKSPIKTLLFSIFLGEFGIDRFYMGKIKSAICKLILCLLSGTIIFLGSLKLDILSTPFINIVQILGIIITLSALIWYIVDICLTYKRARALNYQKISICLDRTKRNLLYWEYRNKISKSEWEMFKKQLEDVPEENVDAIRNVKLKKPTGTLLFSIFLGGIGVDRFYVGDVGIGVAKLVSNVIAYLIVIIPIVFPMFGVEISLVGIKELGILASIVMNIWHYVDLYYTYKTTKLINYQRIYFYLDKYKTC